MINKLKIINNIKMDTDTIEYISIIKSIIRYNKSSEMLKDKAFFEYVIDVTDEPINYDTIYERVLSDINLMNIDGYDELLSILKCFNQIKDSVLLSKMDAIQIIKKIPLFRIVLKQNTLGYCANIDLLEFRKRATFYKNKQGVVQIFNDISNNISNTCSDVLNYFTNFIKK